jgi:protease I
MANSCGLAAYSEMKGSAEYLTPIPWSEVSEPTFDGIVLPGGHAPGMKPYLESQLLQNLVSDFFAAKKLVAAICHGTVLVARSQQSDGRSSLFGYKTTALLRSQELTAWALTFLWLKNYYRTYPETVQSEVTRHLPILRISSPGLFP